MSNVTTLPCAARQVVFNAKDEIGYRRVELAAPQGNQVLVRSHYSVISPGTELAFLRQLPNTLYTSSYPFYPGYSSVAEVVAVGPAVSGLQIGQAVAMQMSHASFALVDAGQCWNMKEKLAPREAAAFRLVSIPLQGIRKAQIQLGESVLIIGLGIIGNIAGQLARAAGATCVVGIDPVEWRRDLAIECGFDHALHPDELASATQWWGDSGPRVVVEVTGTPEAINTAFEAAARLGRVVLLGSTRGNTQEVNFYLHVHRKGLAIFGAHESIRAASEDVGPFWTHHSDGVTALELIAGKRVNLEPLLSATYPATKAREAYHDLMRQDQRLMCIVLDWNDLNDSEWETTL